MLSAFALLGTLAGLAFSFALLFPPTLIPRFHNHPSTPAIFLVNLFYDWIFIGWVTSFIGASIRPASPAFYPPVYPRRMVPSHSPAAAYSAVSILTPHAPYRRAR
jgi:hypothetical protein